MNASSISSVRCGFTGAAVAVTLVMWMAHSRLQPFVYRFQNTLESWLYGSTVVLMVLAYIYAELPVTESRIVVEILMVCILLI